jgi:hypothetical protein
MVEDQKDEGPIEEPTGESTPRVHAKAKKRAKKKGRKRAKRVSPAKAANGDAGKGRTVRDFPASTFQEALVLAEAFQKFAAGQVKVRKITLFDKIGKSPDSGPSRQLITNSSRYGLTKGGYQAEFLELTAEGALATGDDVAPATKMEARFDLAIKHIDPFNFRLCSRICG